MYSGPSLFSSPSSDPKAFRCFGSENPGCPEQGHICTPSLLIRSTWVISGSVTKRNRVLSRRTAIYHVQTRRRWCRDVGFGHVGEALQGGCCRLGIPNRTTTFSCWKPDFSESWLQWIAGLTVKWAWPKLVWTGVAGDWGGGGSSNVRLFLFN